MNIKKYFQDDTTIDVSASQIGISKWTWISIDSQSYEDAKVIMKKNRFDVLPIIADDKSIETYFATVEWNNYDNLNLLKIKDSNTVYYRLSLKDLVRKFKTERRHYYFLTDYQCVLGLVSLVNMNCQLVYNYLYHIISDIERSVSGILREHVTQEQIITEFESSSDQKSRELIAKFKESIDFNLDNDIFQHLYLESISPILKRFILNLPDQYKKLGAYQRKFGTEGVYNKIRSKIMHPVRPILSDKQSIEQIYELLSDYSEIKNIIDQDLTK